jgi:hypothetical protein
MTAILRISMALAALSFVLALYGGGLLYARHLDKQRIEATLPPTDWRAEVTGSEDISALRHKCLVLAELYGNAAESLTFQYKTSDRLALLGASLWLGWCMVAGTAFSYIAYRAWRLPRVEMSDDR